MTDKSDTVGNANTTESKDEKDTAPGAVTDVENIEDETTVAPTRLAEILLDRMTGKLGTEGEILERGRLYQAAIGPALQEALFKATGLEIDVRAAEIHTGRRRKLWSDLNPGKAFCTAWIRGWSSELGYFCGTSIVGSLVECLLGGADPDSIKPTERPMSGIELDMSLMVFEQLNEVLKASVWAKNPEKARAAVSPAEVKIPDIEDDPFIDSHSAAIGFNLEFGPIVAPLFIVAPQSVLLKTRPVRHAALKLAEMKAQADWKQRLGKRVAGSTIRLEARIGLDTMKLSEIGRLKLGDVLPFSEETGARVMLRGNGKDIYTCALGRSGHRYMVQIESAAGTDDNWKKQFS